MFDVRTKATKFDFHWCFFVQTDDARELEQFECLLQGHSFDREVPWKPLLTLVLVVCLTNLCDRSIPREAHVDVSAGCWIDTDTPLSTLAFGSVACSLNGLFKRTIELANHRCPLHVAVSNLIELLLDRSREVVIENVLEVCREEVRYNRANVGREEL